MSKLAGDIKSFLSLNIKSRDDSVTDQYNRLLMVKVMMAAVLVTGLNWYSDDITCIVPELTAGKHLPGYVKASCWINGFYIYKELKDEPGFQGYYGIPTNIAHNGTFGDSVPIRGRTCVATGYDDRCQPLTKEFYLQYQYFPFLLAILGVLYYLPYSFFYRINSDLRSLKRDIEKEKPDYDIIVTTYFSNRTVGKSEEVKVGLNIITKFAYLLVNVVVFESIDFVLNGKFRGYLTRWFEWSELSNEDAHNYVGVRHYIKAGESLLPTFGYCDVLEEAADIKHQLLNEHRFVCEISQNVMYHYVLIAVWLFIVIGFAVSTIGIIEAFIRLSYSQSYMTEDEQAACIVYPTLSLRQKQYMDYIHKMNLERYGQVLRHLFKRLQGGEGSEVDDASKKHPSLEALYGSNVSGEEDVAV